MGSSEIVPDFFSEEDRTKPEAFLGSKSKTFVFDLRCSPVPSIQMYFTYERHTFRHLFSRKLFFPQVFIWQSPTVPLSRSNPRQTTSSTEKQLFTNPSFPLPNGVNPFSEWMSGLMLFWSLFLHFLHYLSPFHLLLQRVYSTQLYIPSLSLFIEQDGHPSSNPPLRKHSETHANSLNLDRTQTKEAEYTCIIPFWSSLRYLSRTSLVSKRSSHYSQFDLSEPFSLSSFSCQSSSLTS